MQQSVYSPAAADHARRLETVTEAEREHAAVWASLTDRHRARLLGAAGVAADPRAPYLTLDPIDRDAVRLVALAQLGEASRLGGFLR